MPAQRLRWRRQRRQRRRAPAVQQGPEAVTDTRQQGAPPSHLDDVQVVALGHRLPVVRLGAGGPLEPDARVLSGVVVCAGSGPAGEEQCECRQVGGGGWRDRCGLAWLTQHRCQWCAQDGQLDIRPRPRCGAQASSASRDTLRWLQKALTLGGEAQLVLALAVGREVEVGGVGAVALVHQLPLRVLKLRCRKRKEVPGGGTRERRRAGRWSGCGRGKGRRPLFHLLPTRLCSLHASALMPPAQPA